MNLSATLFAQFIVFFVLVWVVMRFIWPPLIRALDERRETIAEGLKAAEASVVAKAEAESEAVHLMQEARNEASQLIGRAQLSADNLVAKSREEAKLAGERELEAAHLKMEAELSQVRESLKAQVIELSLLGASKIVEKEVDRETHTKLLNELVGRL